MFQASVYDPDLDLLYVHGGFDLNKALGDFWSYSFKENKWTEMIETLRTVSERRR